MKAIVQAILKEYSLPVAGIHGPTHWARVLENGLRLCELTGANIEVVKLFAVFHDSRRENEGFDPGHGRRGAELAVQLRHLFTLSDTEFALLYAACAGHTDELTDPDVTVKTCFCADRLDLGRVGIFPDLRLCIPAARTIIEWADARAVNRIVPDCMQEWQ